jgi:hypothetical protein
VYSGVNYTLTPLYTKLTLNLLVYVQFILTLKYSTEFTQKLLKTKNIHGIPYTKKHGISRNSAESKSLPHKIPYSAEFQKVTSVDTLGSTLKKRFP